MNFPLWAIIFLIATFIIVMLLSMKLKAEPEKFYYLIIAFYFLISSVQVNNLIPLGFMICLINMLSHPAIKNKKSKWVAIAFGFAYCITSLAVLFFQK